MVSVPTQPHGKWRRWVTTVGCGQMNKQRPKKGSGLQSKRWDQVWVVRKGFLEEVTTKLDLESWTRQGRIFQVWGAPQTELRGVKNGIVCVRNKSQAGWKTINGPSYSRQLPPSVAQEFQFWPLPQPQWSARTVHP